MSAEGLDFRRCPTCKEFGWFGRERDNHRCAPEWSWRIDDMHGPDEWGTIHALDAEDAAVKAGEIYDTDEYSLLRGGEVTVFVRYKGGEVTHWTVSGESVPKYYATCRDEP